MKKLLIAAMFVAFVFAVSCQTPQEIKTTLDKQSEQIKALETKLAEHGAKLEQLKMDYEKHLTDLHKQTGTKKTGTPVVPQAPKGR